MDRVRHCRTPIHRAGIRTPVPTVRRRAGTGRDVWPVRMSVPADTMSRMIDLPEMPFASIRLRRGSPSTTSSPGVWIGWRR